MGTVSGIILDLGISKHQIKDYKRGFSFYINGPLDMRINTNVGLTAFEFLNNYKSKEIFQVLTTYGEEKDRTSYRLTKLICNRRKEFPLKMTLEVSNLIKQIITQTIKNKNKNKNKQHNYTYNNKHPATKIFQAIRCYINNELQNLEFLITSSFKLLNKNKNLIIITFNSLESKLIKQVIKNNINNLFKIYPSSEEVIYNNSSHCATLYIIKKTLM